MAQTFALIRKGADYRDKPQATPRDTVALVAAGTNMGQGAPTLADIQTGVLAWHEDGELVLHSVLARAGASDVVVTRRLATFADDPHTAVAAVRALVARGVRVRILEISGGDPLPYLDFASALLSMMDDMTAQIEAAERRAEDAEKSAFEMADSIYREVVGKLVAEGRIGFDIPQAKEFEADRPEIGATLKALRKQRGMSQAALAEMIGTSQPAVARLEANGRGGELLAKAVAALAGGFNPEHDDPAKFLEAVALKVAASEAEAAA